MLQTLYSFGKFSSQTYQEVCFLRRQACDARDGMTERRCRTQSIYREERDGAVLPLGNMGQMERSKTLQYASAWRGRSYRRFRLEFPVRLKFQSGSSTREINTVSKDLSLGGLLVRSTLPVPQHTMVSFVLSVHGRQSLRPVYLIGEGEVVRVETATDEPFALAIRCNAPVTELEEYLPT